MTKKAFSKHWKESRIEKEIEEIEKFIKFSGGIWEKNEITPSMPWTEEVKRLLGEKVTVTNEFDIDIEKLTKEIQKRKRWTAPGIDGVQNFWWNKLVAAQKALFSAFNRWRTTGRTVLLAKPKDLSDEKNYRPITYLNTSYKI